LGLVLQILVTIQELDMFERRRRIALQEGQPFMETRRYWVDGGDCVD
jgi:hypothetical protein